MKQVTLNGQKFLLRDEPPTFGRLALVARAENSGSESRVMAAYVDLLEGLLDPSVKRGEFEAALSEMTAEQMGKALEEAAGQYTQDPSSAGNSSTSSGGSSPGTPTRKVVSLSKGTVETLTG
jgi:hypothetical protein